METIYIDRLFALNFIIDYLILLGSARICGIFMRRGRYLLAAALGGVYLLSAVILLVNGTVAGIAERMWKPAQSGFAGLKKLGTLETVAAFALIWALYSLAPTPELPNAQTSEPFFKVSLVQRNFPFLSVFGDCNTVHVYVFHIERTDFIKTKSTM